MSDDLKVKVLYVSAELFPLLKTGVLVWIIALPVAALAAAFVLKRKEREA